MYNHVVCRLMAIYPDCKVLCVNNDAHTCDTLYCMKSIHTCLSSDASCTTNTYKYTSMYTFPVSVVEAVATCSCAT